MAESYISELGDSLSHGVANTNGDRVKIIAPKLYNDGNGNHPSIATALSGKSSTSHTHTTSIASDSSSGTVVTLAHDTQYKLTAGGTSVLFKTPADSNTDTKVTQTVDTSNDAAYPILAKNTTATSTVTDTSRFTSGVTLNPKNKSLTATTFIGALSGNASTATKPAVTFLDSTKNLNDYKGSDQGDLLWYRWAASSTPTNVPYGMEGATAVMSVLRMHNTYVRQTVYIAGGHIFTRFFNSSSWSEWDKIYDVTGMAYNYYVQGNIKGTNSTNKYKLLATLKPHLNTQDQLIAVFRVNFFRNNGLEDYADLIINSKCTNSTTPAYTIRAEMLKYGHEVNHAEIKLYQSTATDHVGEVLIYAYAPDTTSNDWGHISLNCLSVNRLYSAEIIRQWVYFEGNGDITGSAPSNATAVTYDVETVVADADITTGSANGTISVAGTDVAVKGLGTAAYTASGNYVAAKPNISSTNMNLIAAMGNCGGIASLAGTDTTINPNGNTGWHHFLNLSYTYQSTNMWQTQIANAAGSTDLWVRSRNGGTVTDGTAWAAPWTRILTGSNWTSVIKSGNVRSTMYGYAGFNNVSGVYSLVATIDTSTLGTNQDIKAIFNIQDLYAGGSNYLGYRKLSINIRRPSSGNWGYYANVVTQEPISPDMGIAIYRTNNSDLRIYATGMGTNKWGAMLFHLVSCTGFDGGGKYSLITLSSNTNATSTTVPSGTAVTITTESLSVASATTATVADSVAVDYTYQVTPTDFDLIVPAVDQARIYSINGQYPNGPSGASTTGYWGILRVFWRNHYPQQLFISYGSSGSFAYYRNATTYDSTEGKWTSWNAWTPFNTDTLVKASADTSTTTYKILATANTSPTSGNATEAKYSANCTITGAGTVGAVAYNVNSKCTLQFNTTTNALDFVFA